MPRISHGMLILILGMHLLLPRGGIRASEQPPRSAEMVEEEFRFAVSLMTDRQEYDLAAPRFAAFADAYPQHPKTPLALSYLAFCQVRMNRDADAVETYARLVRDHPEAEAKWREEAFALGGDAAVRARRYEEAIRLYSELLREFPRSASAEAALYWRAECRVREAGVLAASGKEAEAEAMRAAAFSDYTDFERRFPESRMMPGAVFGAGVVAMERGAYPEAVERFQTFLRRFPEDDRALEVRFRMAEAEYWDGAYARASAGYETVLREARTGGLAAAAAAGMAWCDYATGRIAQAAAGFVRSAELHVDPVAAIRARFDAGNAYREAGMPRQAREQYERVARGGEGGMRAQAYMRLGELSREEAGAATGEARARFLRQAAEALGKAVSDPALGDEAAVAGVYLGEVHAGLGDMDAAAVVLREVVGTWNRHPFAAYAYYHLALAEAGRGDVGAAAEAIRQLLARFPESPLRLQAAFLMAGYQAELGEAARSRGAYAWMAGEGEAWAEAYRTPEGQPDPALRAEARRLAAQSWFRLGEAAQAEGETTTAAEHFRRLIDSYPGDPHVPVAWLRLAGHAAGAGAYGEAIRAYEAAAGAAEALGDDGRAVRRHARFRLGVMHTLRAQTAAGEERAARFGEALAVLDAFRSAYATDPEAILLCASADYYRGEVYSGMGRWAEAVAAYEASYEAAPEGALADAAVFGWGWALRDAGDVAGAERQFTLLLRRFPESAYAPDALFARAVLRRGREGYVEALEDLERILSMEGGARFHDRARLERGRILDRKGRHAEAVTVLEALAESGAMPGEVRAEVLHTLSWALWHKAEPRLEAAKEAERAYRVAVGGRGLDALAGASREAAEEKKAAWQAARDEAWAIEDRMAAVLRMLTEEFPSSAHVDAAYLRLGEVAYDRGEYAGARSMYESALAAAANHPSSDVRDKARYRMAWCLWQEARAGAGESSEQEEARRAAAVEAFDAVAQHHPESPLAPESVYRAGELLLQGGDAAGALLRFDRALGIGDGAKDAVLPEPADWVRQRSLYGRGVALLGLEQYGTARETFRQLLGMELEGDLAREAHWGVGQSALMLRAHEEAAAAFEAARAGGYAGEAAAKARLGLGRIAWQREDWETAREEFRKVDVFHGQWADVAAEALLYAARCSIALGEPERARTDLTRILDRYADTRPASLAREMRKSLDGSTDQTAAVESSRP